jgi:hypothetical protein
VGSFAKTAKPRQGRQIQAMMGIFLSPRPGLESIPHFSHGFTVGYCLSRLRRSIPGSSLLFHAFIGGLKNGFICAWRRA